MGLHGREILGQLLRCGVSLAEPSAHEPDAQLGIFPIGSRHLVGLAEVGQGVRPLPAVVEQAASIVIRPRLLGIELDPKEPRSYHYRGCLLYDRRKWTDALADFRKADEVATSYREYPQLRIWLVRARLGERHAATKELAEYLAAMKSHDDWYSKMARLLTDQLSEDDFFKAAESPDPKTDRGQKCEAYFYAAIRRLIDGDREKAREYLEKCLQTDAKTYFEYSSARSELQALDRGE